MGGYLLSNGSVLVSRCYLGVEVTASVGLTNQLGSFLTNFASLWLNVRWPEITILRAQGRLVEMGQLFARRLGLVMGSFAVLAMFVILVGDMILEWWQTSTQLLPRPYLAIYFLYLWQQLLYVQFGILTLTENVVPFYRVGFYTGLAAVFLSLLLTPVWGLWGVILSPLMAESACSSWFTIRRGFQGQPLSGVEFLRAARVGLRLK
jgi:hypothetical protein